MANRSILLLLVLLFTRGFLSLSENFTFHGFRGEMIHLSGAARVEKNGILRLTNDTHRVLSHALYGSPITLTNSTDGKALSFSAAFVFAILPGPKNGQGGHGFTFTITKSRDLPGAFPSQYLGLMNATHVDYSSNRVFAVEFDTVRDFEFRDIDDNHVGIDINSLVSNASVTATCFTSDNTRKEKCNLQSGKMIQAWIDYSSDRQQVDVTLSLSSSKPSVPILSFPVDLSTVFMDDMYVGFSASTGLLASSHFIAGWSFTTNGIAQSLDLSSLPSIPGLARNQLPVILGASLSAATFVALAVLLSLHIVKKIKNCGKTESWELDIGPHRFSYRELKKSTRGFKDTELLGFGGFGRVYKGTLPSSNTHVAVKRINHESNQGLSGFLSEITSIGRLRHRNLVTLQGWCRHGGDLLLVYDFMPNGSLDKYIFDEPKIVLTWEQRLKIIKGVASGLLYLHEEWEQTVIHRDIKAANVLLDAEMNGRLGDFGLAKLYEHDANPSTTKVVGTLGYLAPELTKTGKPTTSSDVFALGAVLLEVICGRRPVEAKALPEELVLVDWVLEKWGNGSMLEVLDPRLKGEFVEVEAIMVIKLGLMCSNNDPGKRPTTRQVVRYLEGKVPIPAMAASWQVVRYLEGKVPIPAMAALDEINGNDSSDNKHFRSESHFVHSYPSYDGDDDIDLEAGPMSPVPA